MASEGHLCTEKRRQQDHVGRPSMRPASHDSGEATEHFNQRLNTFRFGSNVSIFPNRCRCLTYCCTFLGDSRSEARHFGILTSSCGSALLAHPQILVGCRNYRKFKPGHSAASACNKITPFHRNHIVKLFFFFIQSLRNKQNFKRVFLCWRNLKFLRYPLDV